MLCIYLEDLISARLALISGRTYVKSPHDPNAGSYNPPGMGFNRLSNVVGFSIFLTEIALISAGVRKSKSTLSMAEEIGCEIFMMPTKLAILLRGLRQK